MQAVVRAAGEGERHVAGEREIVIKATGDDTGGALFLAEMVIPPGFDGPPLHRHEHTHDMFYVVEGTLTIRFDDAEHEAGPGTFACAPPGVAHTFANASDAPVRVLNFTTPAGWENYMRDLGEAARSGPPAPEEIEEISARHDCEIV